MFEAVNIGLCNGGSWCKLGRVNSSSKTLKEIASLGDRYDTAFTGRALAQYLSDITMVKTCIGDATVLGPKERGMQIGAQITAGEQTLSRMITSENRPIRQYRKLNLRLDTPVQKLWDAYADKSEHPEYSRAFQRMWFMFNNKDVTICPVGTGENCVVVSDEDGYKHNAFVRAIKWVADKETGDVKCFVVLCSSNTGAKETLEITEFAKKFTPSSIVMTCGNSVNKRTDLISVSNTGVIRPVEIKQGVCNSLVVDNCYVYHVCCGLIKIVGIWNSGKIAWAMSDKAKKRLATSMKSIEDFDMVDDDSPYYKAYLAIKGGMTYLRYVRHMIAPYMSTDSHCVNA